MWCFSGNAYHCFWGMFNLFILLTISDEGRSTIRKIFDKYHKRMLYTATQILGKDRAEEAVHDVFVKLIEKFEKNFEILGDKPGQYFVIIIRNHSLNILKREHMDTVPLDEEHIDIYENSDSVNIVIQISAGCNVSIDNEHAEIYQININGRDADVYDSNDPGSPNGIVILDDASGNIISVISYADLSETMKIAENIRLK